MALWVAVMLAPFAGLACRTSPSTTRPAAARIYVSNQLDNTVSVIDGASHKTVATVRVGVSPAQTAVSPDRKSIYIANTGSDTVSVVSTHNNTVANTITLPRGSRPIGVAVNPNGRYVYTADGGSNRVSVLDTRAGRIVAAVRVGSQPLSVAVAPDGKTVYAANSGSGDVSVIEARTDRVVRAIPTGRFPSSVAVTPDGASLYVTNELSGVTVVDAGTGRVAARLREPSPFSVATSPNGDRAYVTALGPGTITAIDTATHRVASTVSVGPYGTDPFTVRATRHGIYVANQAANTLSVIDPNTFKATATIATGNSPYGIAVVQPPPTAG
jgi:YVTN family beta-propeller protein